MSMKSLSGSELYKVAKSLNLFPEEKKTKAELAEAVRETALQKFEEYPSMLTEIAKKLGLEISSDFEGSEQIFFILEKIDALENQSD